MLYEVTLAPGVEIELQEILDYLEAVYDKSAADKFTISLSTKIKSISQFPRQFPRSERFVGARKCIVHSNFLMYYRILDENQVQVVSLRHGKRAGA